MTWDFVLIALVLVVGLVAAHRERQQRIERRRFGRERWNYGSPR